MVVARNVKSFLTKACQKAYGSTSKPQPWQEEAIVETATKWHEKHVRLFDHPRGSGKTREIVMMAAVAMKQLGIRLVILISDRKDLENQLFEEALRFLLPNGHPEDAIVRCGCAQDVMRVVGELELDKSRKAVLAVTLQSFPHVQLELSCGLRRATAVLADEAHRSHADKSLSEELNRVLGGPVHFLLYTGTATDRCLRLFGEQDARGSGDDEFTVWRAFHSVSEAEVAKRGMIFELGEVRRCCLELDVNIAEIEAVARKLGLSQAVFQSLRARVATSRVTQVVMLKAAYFIGEFAHVRHENQGFQPQMMIVTSSRRAVMDYVEACRACLQGDTVRLTIYGAFSGTLPLASAGGLEEGDGVTESEYNKELVNEFGAKAHRRADILVVCDRFETGYDNECVCLVAVDKAMRSSGEKLVQVYSRCNRKCPGKAPPRVIDVQNPPKDVERAIQSFCMTREAWTGGDGDGQRLSQHLRDALGDLVAVGREDLELGLAAWTAEQRGAFADKLMPYIRRRKEGVSRAAVAGLLPLKQAEVAWKILCDRHRADLPETVAKKMRTLGDEMASRSCGLSMLTLSASVGDFGPLLFGEFVTPQKRRTSCEDGSDAQAQVDTPGASASGGPGLSQAAAGAGELETPEKLELLEALESKLQDGKDLGAPVVSPTDLARDIAVLCRLKASGNRRTFQCLQRIVQASADAANHTALLELDAEAALVGRLVNGDQVEAGTALKAMVLLSAASPRLKRITTAQEDFRILSAACGAKFGLKLQEVQAMKRVAAIIEASRDAADAAKIVADELKEAKSDLDAVRQEKLKRKGFVDSSDSEDSDSAGVFGHFGWGSSRTKTEKKADLCRRRKEARTEAKRKYEAAVKKREATIKTLQETIQQLEKKQHQIEYISDLPSLLVLGLDTVLRRVPSVCKGRYKWSIKASILSAWEAAHEADGSVFKFFGGLSACVKSLESYRRSKAQGVKDDKLSPALSCLKAQDAEGKRMLSSLGALDEVKAICTSTRAGKISFECLEAFGEINFQHLLEAAQQSAAAKNEGEVDAELAVAEALKQAREFVSRQKPSRKRSSAEL